MEPAAPCEPAGPLRRGLPCSVQRGSLDGRATGRHCALSPGYRRGGPEHAAVREHGHGGALHLEPVPERRARGPRPEQLHGDAGLRDGWGRGSAEGPERAPGSWRFRHSIRAPIGPPAAVGAAATRARGRSGVPACSGVHERSGRRPPAGQLEAAKARRIKCRASVRRAAGVGTGTVGSAGGKQAAPRADPCPAAGRYPTTHVSMRSSRRASQRKN
jgi:hypothetical protein